MSTTPARLRIAALAFVAISAGCLRSEPPRFRLNFEGRDRSEVPRDQQQLMVDGLYAMFGSPDEPYVFPESGLDIKKLQLAAGPTRVEVMGEHRGLYRQHCAHCHGISGDGAGPTAATLFPYPRDYRRGIFKFTSTEAGQHPTSDDLKRTLKEGIAGTAMPSFILLPEAELDALVEYVKYLSMRGETEILLSALIDDMSEEDMKKPLDRDALVEECLQPIADQWQAAEDAVIAPPPPTTMETDEQLHAAVERGRKLFLNKDLQCTKCHGPTGLGDGGERIFDVWNDAKKDKTPAEIARLWTLPLQEIRPRNLRSGVYRGGRRPLDLYRRIQAGIKGTPMPNAGQSPSKPTGLTPEQIWDVVTYVRSLPYEPASRPPVAHALVQKDRN